MFTYLVANVFEITFPDSVLPFDSNKGFKTDHIANGSMSFIGLCSDSYRDATTRIFC